MYESEPSTDHQMQLFASQGLTPKIVAAVPQMILASAMVGRGLGYGPLMRRPNNAEVSVGGLAAGLPRPQGAELSQCGGGHHPARSAHPRPRAGADRALRLRNG